MLHKNKHTKGFTLIELMVVISIIGLLSSIVLASLKDAKDKSVATKFKAEINQLVNALELYKNDNGIYPYEDGSVGRNVTAYINNSNSEGVNVTVPFLSTFLYPKYLKSLPQVPANSYAQTYNAWRYQVNSPTLFRQYRCVGDVNLPKYVISFTPQNPFISSIFSDLADTESLTSSGDTWILSPGTKCFSLK